ncbi:MAG: pyridoxal phosphate-dependent aminotransferase [Candidatus Omnitrophica bacterium]|nr:pyridoxal phosphate-dependent aminotransferase [Candidatus Omnitrophota bacterium]
MELASRVINLTSSPTLAVTSKAKQLKDSGVDVVSFGAGEPDFDTPEYIKNSAVKALQAGFTKYTPSTGTIQLRKAIAEKFKRDNNLNYEPSQIVVSNGAKHSLYNIFQVICDKRDEVIIPVPYWVSYPQMVELSVGKSVFIKTKEKNGFKITPEQLKKAIKKRTKALVINSPSNPTGCVYTKEELQAIADIAVEHGIIVISDEIYEKLVYDEAKHVSIASLNEKIYSLTFTVNGLSKAYSMTGWRIGYLAGPKEAVEKISNLQDHSTSCPNSIAQAASVEALTQNEEFIDKMKKEFISRRDYFVKRIKGVRKLSVIKPKGAFYIFCNISRTGIGSLDFSKRLLDEAQVAVIPGIAFGEDKYIRLSFATSMEQITKGMDRIEKWVGSL